ncbi:VCBS repeat-containing protein [Planctomycetota bacterium]|nr:VCBS repeat-containing protein [Planctomycetota bacterium]
MGWQVSPHARASALAATLTAVIATSGVARAQLAAPVDLTSTVNSPRLLPPADVDGDGDADLLVTDAGGQHLFWIEQVPGGVGELTLLLGSPSPSTLWDLADLDGDGDLDVLALTRSPSQLYVHERDGDRYLPARRVTGFSGEAVDVDVGDLDLDGLPDVLVALDANSPAHRGHFLLRGVGGGSLSWPARFTPGSQSTAGIVTGPQQLTDLDGDGDLDVLVLDRDLRRVVWFRNQGATFAQGPLVVDQLSRLSSLEALDLDGDGRLDLVASGTSPGLDFGQEILFYRGTGNGAFVAPVALAVEPTIEPSPLTTGDVDGDGDQDLLFSAAKGAPHWLENLTVGFDLQPRPFAAEPGWSVLDQQLLDLDLDGQPDRVMACDTEQVGWSPGIAAGEFGPVHEITRRADGARAVAALDVDEDGDLDLLVAATGALQVMTLENLGSGDFAAPEPSFEVSGALEEMLAADVDGDGDRDLILVSYSGGWVDVRAFESGQFAPPSRLHSFGAATGGTVTPADADGDGQLDLIVSVLGQGDVLWFQGAPGALDPIPRVLVSNQPSVADLAIRDVDGDGNSDLLLTGPGFGGSVGWFPGHGAGTFGPRVAIPTINFQPRNVVPMDADGDGDLDLIIGGAGFIFPLLEWIPQTSPGQFGAADYVGSAVQGWASIEAIDIDLDGDLDLVTTPREASIEPLALTVYAAPFGGPPLVINRPEGISSFVVDDVDADGDPDVVLTSERADSVTLLRGTARGFLGTAECTGTGMHPTLLEAVGSTRRATNALQLRATRLPPGALTLFLTSQTSSYVVAPGGSLGTLCLGGGIGRFDRPGEAQSVSPNGLATLEVDLAAIPGPSSSRDVLAGETWRFQAWYRASSGGAATTNFTGSLAVEFR